MSSKLKQTVYWLVLSDSSGGGLDLKDFPTSWSSIQVNNVGQISLYLLSAEWCYILSPPTVFLKSFRFFLSSITAEAGVFMDYISLVIVYFFSEIQNVEYTALLYQEPARGIPECQGSIA